MRIRVPRRFLLLGILLCSLALVAFAPQTSLAKPLPWDPSNGPYPGDGDGTVVKGTNASSFTMHAGTTSSTRMKPTVTTLSTWKAYLTALRLGYGWHWLW
jgi:hypothetical protein